jgi:hypothetical protein
LDSSSLSFDDAFSGADMQGIVDALLAGEIGP